MTAVNRPTWGDRIVTIVTVLTLIAVAVFVFEFAGVILAALR
jgi:hypothetical protein